MYFSSRPIPRENLANIRFRNEIIEWVKDYKYLGLHLSSNMSFATHIDKLCTRVCQYTGISNQLKKSVPQEIIMKIYNSLLLPHLTLHIEIWGASQEVYLNKLAIKQNNLLRVILSVKYENWRPVGQTSDLYETLHVLTVRSIYKLQLFKFLWDLLTGKLPYFHELLLAPMAIQHRYENRGRIYRHPLLTCEVERRGLQYQLIKFYETLDVDFYIGVSKFRAVKNYKKFLLDNQF